MPNGIVNSEEMVEFWREGIKKALVPTVLQNGMTITEASNESKLNGLPISTEKSKNES